MVHPMFWTAARRLAFLCDASDRFEIMELQPPEPTLCQLESKASEVIGQSWQKRLDSVFLDNLGKHRKYDSKSLRDLLRALRNKVSASLWAALGRRAVLDGSQRFRQSSETPLSRLVMPQYVWTGRSLC
jgi:hypothetical protein